MHIKSPNIQSINTLKQIVFLLILNFPIVTSYSLIRNHDDNSLCVCACSYNHELFYTDDMLIKYLIKIFAPDL